MEILIIALLVILTPIAWGLHDGYRNRDKNSPKPGDNMKWHEYAFLARATFYGLLALLVHWAVVLFAIVYFYIIFEAIQNSINHLPIFYYGSTAKTDKQLRKWFGTDYWKVGAIKISLLIITIILVWLNKNHLFSH